MLFCVGFCLTSLQGRSGPAIGLASWFVHKQQPCLAECWLCLCGIDLERCFPQRMLIVRTVLLLLLLRVLLLPAGGASKCVDTALLQNPCTAWYAPTLLGCSGTGFQGEGENTAELGQSQC